MISTVAANWIERVKEQFREICANHAKLSAITDAATKFTHPYFTEELYP